jgi:hypothetical protein
MSTRTKIAIAALAGVVAAVVGLRCLQISSADAAIGDVTNVYAGEVKGIEMLASATATNSPPSGASAGLEINALRQFGKLPDKAALVIASTAGSGTMTATFRIWGRVPMGSGIWVPLGPGADATKGVINLETAIGETGADTLRHTEMIENLALFDRLYLEITAIGGTSTAVTAWLVVRQPL